MLTLGRLGTSGLGGGGQWNLDPFAGGEIPISFHPFHSLIKPSAQLNRPPQFAAVRPECLLQPLVPPQPMV